MITVAAKNAAFLVLASRYQNSDLVYSEDFIQALDEALEAAARHMGAAEPLAPGRIALYHYDGTPKTADEIRNEAAAAASRSWWL